MAPLPSFPIPKVSTEDDLHQAGNHIINLITNPIAHFSYLHIGDKTQNIMLQIVQMLNLSIYNIVNLNPTKPPANHALPTSNGLQSLLPKINKHSLRVKIKNAKN